MAEETPKVPDARDVEALAEVVRRARMVAYEDGMGGWLWPDDMARAILASDWLAAHDEQVRREERERIAQAIETRGYVGASGNAYGQGYYDGHRDGREEAARIARQEQGGDGNGRQAQGD